MRKNVSLILAICGTLLLLLILGFGRLIYIHTAQQPFSSIAETGPQTTIKLAENDTEVPLNSEKQQAAIIDLLSQQTYTPYPHFIKPSKNKLTANRLTVTFENGNSIGLSTDGYVFVNGNLRGIKGDNGVELYHELFVLFYPTAA